MTADFRLEQLGGGYWDAVLAETEDGPDFDLVGDSAETHPQATLQRIAYAVGVWLGESPFDRNAGFPWEQAVFGRSPIPGIAVFLQEAVQGVEGVEGIENEIDILYDAAARRVVIAPVRVQGESFEVTFGSEIVV